MKKFGQFVKEELAGALVEPQSDASAQAKKLGLTYVGFGRYEDQTGQVSHIVQNDRLIPFAKAVRSKSFKDMSTDDFGEYTKNMKNDVDQIHSQLTDAYSPENYDNAELDAIKDFTASEYYTVNDKLAGLPTGIPAEQIQPEYDGDTRPELVAALDSALSKVKAPIDFIGYVGLQDQDIFSMSGSKSVRFKGFRSITIDPNVVLQSGDPTVLQIKISAGDPGMYVDDYSSVPGEGEYLLPRGSEIKVISGPNKISGSHALSQDANKQIRIYNCVLVK
jgi:hypothetical protein